MNRRIHALSTEDETLIARCLRAAIDGPFFPDPEFGSLFGMSRERLAAIAAEWPANRDLDETETAAINAVNNLLGYPHGREDEVLRRTDTTSERLEALLFRLAPPGS